MQVLPHCECKHTQIIYWGVKYLVKLLFLDFTDLMILNNIKMHIQLYEIIVGF